MIRIGYREFLKLCRVAEPDLFTTDMCVNAGGVYQSRVGVLRTVEMRAEAEASGMRHVEAVGPALLAFPCTLELLHAFLDRFDLTARVDAFELARFVERQLGRRTDVDSGFPAEWPEAPHISGKLATLTHAARRFWGGKRAQEPAGHPTMKDVADWLVARGYTATQAAQAAQVLRPDWAEPAPKSPAPRAPRPARSPKAEKPAASEQPAAPPPKPARAPRAPRKPKATG